MKKSAKKFNLTLISSLILSSLAITACGGHSSHDPDPQPAPDPDKVKITITERGDIFTGKPYVIAYTVENTESDNGSEKNTEIDGFTVTAKYGEVSTTHPQTGQEAPKGIVYYYVPEEVLGQSDDFYNLHEVITITNKDKKSAVKEFDIGTKYEGGDPIFADAWHIKNTGQNPFKVPIPPVKGMDLGVIPAWHLKDANNELISGKGVTVGVVDTPVDIEHEDLSNKIHYILGAPSYVNSGITIEEIMDDDDNLHGTAVSGIIGAEANNGKGVRGIAFESPLTSFGITSNDMSVFTDIMDYRDINLYNASIGFNSSYSITSGIDTSYQALFENNIPFIKAAGNEFDDPDLFDDDDDDDTRRPVTLGESKGEPVHYPYECHIEKVECQYNQLSDLNRGRYVIQVAGINSLGYKSSYSSSGSFLWVAGTSGETGYDGNDDSSAAIVSTLSRFNPKDFDDWDYGTPWRKDKKNYDIRKFYTHRMDGTSAATPSITGISALIKQAKPDLTVPQLRYILASTSNNDQTDGWSTLAYEPQEVSMPEFDNEKFTADYGWYSNAAGFRFSNHYGFGVANAEKAVKKALSCNDDVLCAKRSSLPDDFISTNTDPCSSEDGGRNVTCVFTDFANQDNPAVSVKNIEIEQTSINLSSFRHLRNSDDPVMCLQATEEDPENITPEGLIYSSFNLQIDMTSPKGTKTLIKPIIALWDYNADIMKEIIKSSDYDFDYYVNNTSYFTETFTQEDKFVVTFRSKCSIDVDTLNKNIHVLIGGYAE